MSKVDYLTEDSILPHGQKYVCLSFLTDKENKTTLSGIKIRGVFETYDEACEHCKKLQTVDPAFNVFVGEMGKWLPFDPNPDSQAVKDSEYANDQLNNMMKGYLENQEKAKLYHEQRKNEMVRQNILDNLQTRHDTMNDLKKKANKAKGAEADSIQKNITEIENQIKKMEEKKTEIDAQIENLSSQVKDNSKLTSQLAGPKVIGDV
jgi:molecular chaperone DnaK (HSP70)